VRRFPDDSLGTSEVLDESGDERCHFFLKLLEVRDVSHEFEEHLITSEDHVDHLVADCRGARLRLVDGLLRGAHKLLQGHRIQARL